MHISSKYGMYWDTKTQLDFFSNLLMLANGVFGVRTQNRYMLKLFYGHNRFYRCTNSMETTKKIMEINDD